MVIQSHKYTKFETMAYMLHRVFFNAFSWALRFDLNITWICYDGYSLQ